MKENNNNKQVQLICKIKTIDKEYLCSTDQENTLKANLIFQPLY